MRSNPKPFEIYRHFKGNIYQIMTLATDSENGKDLVVYQALYGDYKVYVRPLEMFMEPVDREKYPNADQEYRFELVNVKAEKNKATDSEVKEDVKIEVQEAVKPEIKAEEKQQTVETNDTTEEEYQLDPAVLEFLDAKDYEAKLNILTGIHHRLTDDMLNTMAIASDIELDEGDLETRYQSFKYCLSTKQKFEKVRPW